MSQDDPHKLPDTTSERKVSSEALLALYRPKTILRAEQKKLLKTAWSIGEGLDGTKLSCSYCHEIFKQPGMTVHHKDGNDGNNDLANLTPACWECNRREAWIVRRRLKAQAQYKEKENIRTGFGDSSLQTAADRILQLNAEGEDKFRRFLIEHILHYGSNPTKDALEFLRPDVVRAAAANWSGMNLKTVYPYFQVIANPINGFIEVAKENKTRIRYVRFRFPDYYEKTVDQILELNPKEGLAKRHG